MFQRALAIFDGCNTHDQISPVYMPLTLNWAKPFHFSLIYNYEGICGQRARL